MGNRIYDYYFNDHDKGKFTEFTFKIPQHELQEIQHCKVGEYFKSDRFKSEKELEWFLKIYPNGRNDKNKGHCMVFLRLSSASKSYGAIIVYCTLRCDQTHASHQYILRYDNLMGKGWEKGVQSFAELRALKDLSFSCKVRILRIEDHSGHSLYEYTLDPSSLWKREKVQWEVDACLRHKMKTAPHGKKFCSRAILSDSGLFSLYVFPNGVVGAPKGYKSKVIIGFSFCVFPSGVHSMKIRRSVEVPELNKKVTWVYTFSYDVPSCDGVICSVADLKMKGLKTLTFNASIEILECYSDSKGTLIHDVAFQCIKDNRSIEDQKQEAVEDDEVTIKEYNIRKGKALVAIVAVKEYQSKHLDDVDGSVVDRQKLKELFEREFQYTTRILKKDRITKRDFDDFMYSVRNELYSKAQQYDAFIFSFTGHGYQDSICLSDSVRFGRIALYKYFNGTNCVRFKDKPKFFLLQACKGRQDAQNVNDQGRMALSGNIGSGNLPVGADDNIVIFESNSDDYVSWINGNGGYMIQSFVKVMSKKTARLALDDLAKHLELEVKRLNKKMASVETVVCNLKGIKDKIYFCKSEE